MHTKYLKRIIAFVIVLSMVFTTVAMAMPYGQAKKFIRNGYSWEEVQEYVQGKGIMKGFPDGKFYEDLNVKRADAIVMIDRAFKLNALIDSLDIDYDDEKFDDVDENEYYFHAIYIAKLLGITKGTGNNKFKPNQSVTINEVILLIERAMEKNKDFEFEKDIDDLYDEYEEDLKDFATRGEIAAMLYYILTGSKYDGELEYDDEVEDKIKRTMEENEILEFGEKYGNIEKLIKSIKDAVNDDDFEYVKFTKNNDFLYYEYDEDSDSNSLVRYNGKYFIQPDEDEGELDLSNVTIVTKTSGVLIIDYKVYDEDDDVIYKGIIEITVEPMFGELTIEEDDFDHFGEEVKEHLEDNEDYDEYDFETIVFERLKNDKDYDLNYKNKTRSLIGAELDIEDDLGKVVFNPKLKFDGATLKYTVTTDDGLQFTGLITVEIDD